MTESEPHSQAGIDKWLLAEPSSTAKGFFVRIYRNPCAPDRPPKLQLCLDGDAPLQVERAGAERVSLGITDNEALLKSLADWDAFALEMASQKCQAWFKRSIAPQQLATMLRPVLQTQERILDLPVSPDVCAWSLASDGTYSPSDLAAATPGRRVWVCVEVAGLSFAQRDFGLSLVLSDVLLLPECPRSPKFAFRSSLFAFSPVGTSEIARDEEEENYCDHDVPEPSKERR